MDTMGRRGFLASAAGLAFAASAEAAATPAPLRFKAKFHKAHEKTRALAAIINVHPDSAAPKVAKDPVKPRPANFHKSAHGGASQPWMSQRKPGVFRAQVGSRRGSRQTFVQHGPASKAAGRHQEMAGECLHHLGAVHLVVPSGVHVPGHAALPGLVMQEQLAELAALSRLMLGQIADAHQLLYEARTLSLAARELMLTLQELRRASERLGWISISSHAGHELSIDSQDAGLTLPAGFVAPEGKYSLTVTRPDGSEHEFPVEVMHNQARWLRIPDAFDGPAPVEKEENGAPLDLARGQIGKVPCRLGPGRVMWRVTPPPGAQYHWWVNYQGKMLYGPFSTAEPHRTTATLQATMDFELVVVCLSGEGEFRTECVAL